MNADQHRLAHLSRAVAVLETQQAAARELFKETRISDQRALKHQATEYERRLNELNHAHERASVMQAEFVRQDTYDAGHRDLGMRLGVINDRVAALERANSALLGRLGVAGPIIGLVGAVVGGLITKAIFR